jgi:hypothetical protein
VQAAKDAADSVAPLVGKDGVEAPQGSFTPAQMQAMSELMQASIAAAVPTLVQAVQAFMPPVQSSDSKSGGHNPQVYTSSAVPLQDNTTSSDPPQDNTTSTGSAPSQQQSFDAAAQAEAAAQALLHTIVTGFQGAPTTVPTRPIVSPIAPFTTPLPGLGGTRPAWSKLDLSGSSVRGSDLSKPEIKTALANALLKDPVSAYNRITQGGRYDLSTALVAGLPGCYRPQSGNIKRELGRWSKMLELSLAAGLPMTSTSPPFAFAMSMITGYQMADRCGSKSSTSPDGWNPNYTILQLCTQEESSGLGLSQDEVGLLLRAQSLYNKASR